ncbi:Uncharacterised protein [Collinsella intestinalis]|nr:Uncharacterised protein [Collinsella intestinalis]
MGELLHERGNGAPLVNMFPARELLPGAGGLLALAGGLGRFAARRALRLARRDVFHLDFHIDGLLRTVFGAAGHLHSGMPQHLQNLVVVHRGINPSVFRQLEKWYPLHALGNANGDKSGITVICPPRQDAETFCRRSVRNDRPPHGQPSHRERNSALDLGPGSGDNLLQAPSTEGAGVTRREPPSHMST